MNSNDVVLVIDTICEKLGIAAEAAAQIVPRLAMAHIAEQCATILLLLVGMVVCCVVIRKVYVFVKRDVDESDSMFCDTVWDSPGFVFVAALTCMFVVVAVIALFILIPDTVGWIVAPDAKAVQYVISMIGG